MEGGSYSHGHVIASRCSCTWAAKQSSPLTSRLLTALPKKHRYDVAYGASVGQTITALAMTLPNHNNIPNTETLPRMEL